MYSHSVNLPGLNGGACSVCINGDSEEKKGAPPNLPQKITLTELTAIHLEFHCHKAQQAYRWRGGASVGNIGIIPSQRGHMTFEEVCMHTQPVSVLGSV